jgi:hypothetical protein
MDDKTPPMDVNEGRVIAFVDIETDSLDATKIYVCCVKRTTDKQVQVYTDPDKFKKETTDIDKFIGHNIIDFVISERRHSDKTNSTQSRAETA